MCIIIKIKMYNQLSRASIDKSPSYYLKGHKKSEKGTNSLSIHKTKSEPSLLLSPSAGPLNPHITSNGIKLANSYYNDRRQIYINKSRLLSEKSLRYQSREISYSERRKYNEKKIQTVVQRRDKNGDGWSMGNKTMSLPRMDAIDRGTIKNKITTLNAKKYSQLLHGSKNIDRKVKILIKQSTHRRQQSSIERKWTSPFRDTNTFKTKFEGKNVVPKKVESILANSNSTELKVLNLDRLFRVKDGKLGNVVPIPVAKLSEISSRTHVVKTIKKKDTIHQIIQQFNKLLKIAKLSKINQKTKRIGVRGHNFTKSPTLQQLMGIKLHQFQTKKSSNNASSNVQHQQQISQQIFFTHSRFYQQHMKKDIHLSRRLVAGLKQQKNKLNLAAYTRFYSIFINKVSTIEQNIKFLVYFFIPTSQQKIQLNILKLILQLMCQQLPQITSLKVQSQFLTKQEKSKIFLQALNRVLFAQLKDFIGGGQVMINRQVLAAILARNQDAVSLLIRLLLIQ